MTIKIRSDIPARFRPEFARNAADALQCYADIQRSVAQLTDEEVGIFCSHPDIPTLRVWLQKSFSAVAEGTEIYFWPAITAETVTKHAQSYPLEMERFTLPPENHIVFVFQRPTLYIEGVPVTAISYVDMNGEAAWMWPWIWIAGSCFPMGFQAVMRPSGLIDEYQKMLKWLCSADSFAKQRLIGAEPTRVTRAVVDRIVGHVPEVNVVHLRRVDHRGTHRDTLKHIDFEARFWVRGHERRLPQSEETIWIETYLKGPDDKPIKDRQTVYAVTR
jgi:hypothetical protein